MPTYEYKCPYCGRVQTAQRTVEYRDDGPRCDHVAEIGGFVRTERQLAAPMGRVDGPAVPRGS